MADTNIDSIILSDDRRKMSLLRPYLPPDTCLRAARLAHENRARVVIVTGFYLNNLNTPETDGPPGALAIGRALATLGSRVTYVTDRYTFRLLEAHAAGHASVAQFPIMGLAESEACASRILAEIQPTLIVAIERCGVTADGAYRNVRGQDISAHTARLDTLIREGVASIGIGDGGNEIGMGNLAAVIPGIPGLPACPAVTRVNELIVASVSNWGGYGLVAGLSRLAGRDLLPREDEESHLIESLFAAGCYDGTHTTPTCGVDGYSLAENAAILTRLRAWLAAQS